MTRGLCVAERWGEIARAPSLNTGHYKRDLKINCLTIVSH